MADNRDNFDSEGTRGSAGRGFQAGRGRDAQGDRGPAPRRDQSSARSERARGDDRPARTDRGYGRGGRPDGGDGRGRGAEGQRRGYGADDTRPRSNRDERGDSGRRSEGSRGHTDRATREEGAEERRSGGQSRGYRSDRRAEAPRGGDGRRGYGQSSGDRGGRPPRDGQGDGRRGREARLERDEQDAFVRPGLAAREDEPPTPQDVDERVLPGGVRAELRGLPKDLGHVVAAHLVAAGELIDEDPELAYRHAEAARRRAARLPVVREATAETAYAAGEYAVALNEYRALRRMTGGADYLPVMADCERALGRPNNALRLAKESLQEHLEPAQRVEMLIVEAGARDDLGQSAEGLRLLKNAISQKVGSAAAQARLRYAYADMLERHGDGAAARQWFVSAVSHDHEEALDAQDRVDRLDGFVVEADLDEDDDVDAATPESDPDDAEDR